MKYVTELNIPIIPKMAPEVVETVYDKMNDPENGCGPFRVFKQNVDKRMLKFIDDLGCEVMFAEGYQSGPRNGRVGVHKDGCFNRPDRVKLNFTYGDEHSYFDFYKVKDESKVKTVYLGMQRSTQYDFLDNSAKIHHYITEDDNLEHEFTYQNNHKWHLARIHEFHGSRNLGVVPRKTIALILRRKDDPEGKWISWDEAHEIFKDYITF